MLFPPKAKKASNECQVGVCSLISQEGLSEDYFPGRKPHTSLGRRVRFAIFDILGDVQQHIDV